MIFFCLRKLFAGLCFFALFSCAQADTLPTLLESYAGFVNFVGTQKTIRTASNNSDPCSVTTGTTQAAITGIPAAATIKKAYLYWAGSGSTPDYTVTFDGNAVTAERQYVSNDGTNPYFSGVVDVTTIVISKRNGTYSFSGLTVDTSNTYCSGEGVSGGWALLVVYENTPTEIFRVLNIYEGFQVYRYNSITLSMSNFKLPASVTGLTGKAAHITWEGDSTLSAGGENLTFQMGSSTAVALTDTNNPSGNQFNSTSNITAVTPSTGSVDTASYGVDFDAYLLDSTKLVVGATTATTVYSSGQDQVFLSAEIISVPNIPVADLAITNVGSTLTKGANATYTITVNNNGPNSDTSTITVTDTLPTGLTFVSASGTGWSCSNAGQVVTCTLSGGLASGVSAASITLTVAVSATASGAISNTASVTSAAITAGTVFDNVSGNNTATATYLGFISFYAYYRMDETNWTTASSITDLSGNSRNASTITLASTTIPTGYPVADPPASAIPGSIGTCGAGFIPNNSASTQGITTPVEPDVMGNQGSIAFWYADSTAWDDGNDRMLFDASNNLGNGSVDKHFYLVKRTDGSLMFAIEDSADLDITATSSSYSYNPVDWHHIAVTWSLATGTNASRIRIYLDGVLVGSSTVTTSGSLGNASTLYLGARRPSGVSGTPSNYTANSAYGYMDEVYIHNSELVLADIVGLKNATHTCAGAVDHYELSVPSASVACLTSPVIVTACADNTSPCTNLSTGMNGQTATLTATAGVSLGASPVTFSNAGTATTTLSYPAAPDNTNINVTLSGESKVATYPRKCCPDGTSCAASNSCTTNFKTAGFTISNALNGGTATLTSQIAGVSSGTYYLRAVKTNTTNKACEGALSGAQSVNFAYECVSNPSTCYGSNLMSVNGGSATTIQRNNSGSVTSYTPVTVSFDANGNAPFTFNYGDVGVTKLWVSKASGGSLLSSLAGSSNAFVVKPYAFVVSNVVRTSDSKANPAAANAAGGAFMAAGDAFSATVTAVTSSNTTTPSFGRCDSSNGTACSAASETVAFMQTLVSPATGASGSLGGTTSVAASNFVANNGVYTFTNLNWSEVGVITLLASNNNYLSNALGSCATTTPGLACQNTYGTTGNVGRFHPKYFLLTLTPPPNCTGFVYGGHDGVQGQPFTVVATAYNGLSPASITTNYSNALGYAKNLNLTLATGGGTVGSLYLDSVAGGNNAIPASKFVAGTGTVNYNDATGRISYVFTASPTAPTTITLHGDDADSATSTSTGDVSTQARFGRLRLSNVFGSEKTALRIPLQALYWSGNSWVLNSADSCTVASLAINAFNLSNSAASNSSVQSVSLVNGTGSVQLAAPGMGHAGSVDVAANLGTSGSDNSCLTINGGTPASLPWLRSRNGSCATTYTRDPSARATFGIFSPETRRTIHVRELF